MTAWQKVMLKLFNMHRKPTDTVLEVYIRKKPAWLHKAQALPEQSSVLL